MHATIKFCADYYLCALHMHIYVYVDLYKIHTLYLITLPSHSQDGFTALLMASQEGHASTVDVLLRNGADPNIVNRVSALCLLTLLMTRFALELE